MLEDALFGNIRSAVGRNGHGLRRLKGAFTISEQELVQLCLNRLSPDKIPHRVEFFDAELPESASGKILKRGLRERLWGGEQRAIA